MRSRTAVLAATLAMAPLGAWGADLVVCWQKGFYAQRDEALSEIVAGFEQGVGEGLDRRPMGSEGEVAKATKASSGRDDSNSKIFFDYKAAARLTEVQNAWID